MSEPIIEATEAEDTPATDTSGAEPATEDTQPTATPEPEASQELDAEVDTGEPEPREGEEKPEANGPASKARKEAARYRAQLRTVQGRANAMRDQLIEHELGLGGVKLAALTAAGIDLDSLVGEDGRISPEAVQTAAQTARETLGIPNNRFQGTADQGRVPPTYGKPAPTWGTLLDPTKPATR